MGLGERIRILAERATPELVGRPVALHAEILPDSQRDVLRVVGPWSAGRGFYLAGGTAVALHLGHRMSIDFDFFGTDPITAPRRFINAFRSTTSDIVNEIQCTRGTVYVQVGGVTTSWFRYLYPLLRPPGVWRKTLVASLDDLAAMKLAAIYDRGSRKDFVDVFALLENGYLLADLIERFQEKYPRANVDHLVRSLQYFDRADQEASLRMLLQISWPAVKRRIRQAVTTKR
jgi:hypothetical protein